MKSKSVWICAFCWSKNGGGVCKKCGRSRKDTTYALSEFCSSENKMNGWKFETDEEGL